MTTRSEVLERYEAACAASDAAFRAYDPILAAFRDGHVSTDEYLKARADYQAVLAVFDAAYAAVQDLPEEAEAAPTDDAQLSMFA